MERAPVHLAQGQNLDIWSPAVSQFSKLIFCVVIFSCAAISLHLQDISQIIWEHFLNDRLERSHKNMLVEQPGPVET